MFERFSEKARQVMRLAQEEARDLNYNHVGTEAILLALVRQQDGTAGTVLASLGITLEGVRAQLVGLVFPEEETVTGHIPFTPRAKKSLELALRESLGLRSEYIGTGHILLGLLSQSDSIATRVLNSFEPDSNKLREAVLPMLSDPEEPPAGRFANRVNLTMVRDTPAVAAAGPDPALRRLLMAAGARAVQNEQAEYGLADLLAAAKDIEAQADSGSQDPGDLG